MKKLRIDPKSIETEKGLLGAIISGLDDACLSDVMEKVNDTDFYIEKHQKIFRAIENLYLKRKEINLITVTEELQQNGEYEFCGEEQYLVDLCQYVPSPLVYKEYMEFLLQDSTRRKLIQGANEIIHICQGDTESDEALASAEKIVFDIAQKTYNSTLLGVGENEDGRKAIDKFNQISSDKKIMKGLYTGFTALDRLTNGLHNGDLIIIAGRPGMGKTSFAMNIVEYLGLTCGKTCAVFSLEMSREQLVERLLCSYSFASMAKALSGELSTEDWKHIVNRGEPALRSSKIFIDDSARITPSDILSKCRMLKLKKGLDLVMVDYLQLMYSGKKREENRQQEIANITRELKIIAKELDVPVIALSQLRRLRESEEPSLSDLRESGAIEQDADIVMFISRAEFLPPEELQKRGLKKDYAEVRIVKHRNGALGYVPLKFRGELTKFVNSAEDVGFIQYPDEEK